MQKKILLLIFSISFAAYSAAQNVSLDFFLQTAISNSEASYALANNARLTNERDALIIAENKKPNVYLSAEYLFAPFLFDSNHVFSIAPEPSLSAYGYDADLTNGGIYSALINVSIPLFHTAVTNALREENTLQGKISETVYTADVHDLEKIISDQYITAWAEQENIRIASGQLSVVRDRKKIMAELIRGGLFSQTDYQLLQLEENRLRIDSSRFVMAYTGALDSLKIFSKISSPDLFILTEPVIEKSEIKTSFHNTEKRRLDSLSIAAQQNVMNAAYKPQLNFLGNAGLNSADISEIGHHFGFSADIQLKIPIYDGNRRQHNEEINHILLDSISFSGRIAAVQITARLISVENQITALQNVATMQDEQAALEEKYLDVLKKKLLSGESVTTEYVIATQESVALQHDQLDTKRDMLLLLNLYNYYNW